LPQVETFGDKSRIASEGTVAIKPPLADLKWQGPVPGVTIAPPVPQSQLTITPGPTPVPSSVKVGLRLENFALYDLNLQPWELRSQAQGKLLLLDFWKTTCPPCLQEIPTIKMLASQYRPLGLEVVGIAYEDAGTVMSQANNVAGIARERGINYQVLLGGGANCPLKRNLNVRAWPTLVLLDETGGVIWQHEGALDRAAFSDLDLAIKWRLARR
jgi:thiol-disulfide isomerase/thioredoxin